MNAEQHYTITKANFIAASKALHLAYDTYDPQFQFAADAVRQVFKAEPVADGRRRTTEENTAAVALTAIMRELTDITDTRLAKMLLKKFHSAVGSNMRKHWELAATNKHYCKRWASVLQTVKDSEICNT